MKYAAYDQNRKEYVTKVIVDDQEYRGYTKERTYFDSIKEIEDLLVHPSEGFYVKVEVYDDQYILQYFTKLFEK